MTAIRVRINGSEVADDVPPRLSLADFLRERRNLTGPISPASTACAARARSLSTAIRRARA